MADPHNAAPPALEIRSFRTVFDLERRIYRVDRLRLNPGGVPLRGVVYFAALALAAFAAARVAPLGWAMRVIPWYLRDLALPAAGAAALAIVRVEGRPFHLAARALVRHAVAARHLSSLRPVDPPGRRWWPPDLLVLPDGSDAQHRLLAFRGPGAVRIATSHERVIRRGWARWLVRGRPDLIVYELARRRPRRAQVIELAAGATLQVRRVREP